MLSSVLLILCSCGCGTPSGPQNVREEKGTSKAYANINTCSGLEDGVPVSVDKKEVLIRPCEVTLHNIQSVQVHCIRLKGPDCIDLGSATVEVEEANSSGYLCLTTIDNDSRFESITYSLAASPRQLSIDSVNSRFDRRPSSVSWPKARSLDLTKENLLWIFAWRDIKALEGVSESELLRFASPPATASQNDIREWASANRFSDVLYVYLTLHERAEASK
jgi:hypothetical protein